MHAASRCQGKGYRNPRGKTTGIFTPPSSLHRPPAGSGGAASLYTLARWWERGRAIDPRYLIAFLITLVLVAAQLRYHMVGGYDRLVLALAVCMVTEALLSWFDRGKIVNLLSAYSCSFSS